MANNFIVIKPGNKFVLGVLDNNVRLLAESLGLKYEKNGLVHSIILNIKNELRYKDPLYSFDVKCYSTYTELESNILKSVLDDLNVIYFQIEDIND